MSIAPEIASVINNVLTIFLVIVLIDRAHSLFMRWLELHYGVDVHGPRPLVIKGSRISREEEKDPTA